MILFNIIFNIVKTNKMKQVLGLFIEEVAPTQSDSRHTCENVFGNCKSMAYGIKHLKYDYTLMKLLILN